MSEYPRAANGWPERLRAEPVPLPELPDHPTPAELARAYGTVVVLWSRHWPMLVEAFQWLYGVFIGRAAAIDTIDERLARIELQLVVSKLPPMRGEMASSHAVAHEVARDVAQRFDQETKNPSTPPPDANAVERMVAERVANELLRIKADELEKREAQRELSAKLAADKKKALRRLYVSLGVTAISVAGAILEHFLR